MYHSIAKSTPIDFCKQPSNFYGWLSCINKETQNYNKHCKGQQVGPKRMKQMYDGINKPINIDKQPTIVT